MKGLIMIYYDDDYKNCSDRYADPVFFKTNEKICEYLIYQIKCFIADRYNKEKTTKLMNELDSITTIEQLQAFRNENLQGNYIYYKIGWNIFNVKEVEDEIPIFEDELE